MQNLDQLWQYLSQKGKNRKNIHKNHMLCLFFLKKKIFSIKLT